MNIANFIHLPSAAEDSWSWIPITRKQCYYLMYQVNNHPEVLYDSYSFLVTNDVNSGIASRVSFLECDDVRSVCANLLYPEDNNCYYGRLGIGLVHQWLQESR